MNNVWILCRKELKSYFASPIAYGLMAFFAIGVLPPSCARAGRTPSPNNTSNRLARRMMRSPWMEGTRDTRASVAHRFLLPLK